MFSTCKFQKSLKTLIYPCVPDVNVSSAPRIGCDVPSLAQAIAAGCFQTTRAKFHCLVWPSDQLVRVVV